MQDTGAYNIGGAYAGARAGATANASAAADASAGAEVARRAALEAAREGDQRAHREAMGTLMATGDLIPAADYNESGDEDRAPDEEQSEIAKEDEDAPRADGWDDAPLDRPEHPLRPFGNGADEVEAVENIEPFRILVDGDTCRFERPDWWNCKARTTAGRSFVADSERTFRMMSAIADWLSNNRKEFLLDPDPWNLGVSAMEEFQNGWASVRQKDFLEYAGLRSFAGPSLFSRNIRKTDLVSDGGPVPLEFLFEDEARMAWVAQVVKGLAQSQGGKMQQVLENYADVTVPKGGRDDLLKAEPDTLDFGGLIARACVMAGKDKPVSWSATIKTFKNRMLE